MEHGSNTSTALSARADGEGRPYVQVDIVQLEFLQAGLQSTGDVRDITNHFRGHEELATRYARFFDGRPELGLCLVHLGAVEMVVLKLDGQLGAVNACLVDLRLVPGLVPRRPEAVAKLPAASALLRQWWIVLDMEPHHRDAVPIVQLQIWDWSMNLRHRSDGAQGTQRPRWWEADSGEWWEASQWSRAHVMTDSKILQLRGVCSDLSSRESTACVEHSHETSSFPHALT